MHSYGYVLIGKAERLDLFFARRDTLNPSTFIPKFEYFFPLNSNPLGPLHHAKLTRDERHWLDNLVDYKEFVESGGNFTAARIQAIISLKEHINSMPCFSNVI